MLQVSVLTDQVEAQGEKIRDLETSIVTEPSKKGAKNAANRHVSNMKNLATSPAVVCLLILL